MNQAAQELADKPGSQADKARRLLTSQSTIARLLTGTVPTLRVALQAEKEYGIAPGRWFLAVKGRR
jgi:transcriptional regulator with XRE-family HTH domain